jgi:hypothetical protein
MENLLITPAFEIDEQDLQILFLKTNNITLSKSGFEGFKQECHESYSNYFHRNLNNLEKYGQPKTFSQWVNGQIIALDYI